MASYFVELYLHHAMGPGYILTNILFVFFLSLLYEAWPERPYDTLPSVPSREHTDFLKTCGFRIILRCLGLGSISLLLSSILYGHGLHTLALQALLVFLCALTASRIDPFIRLARGSLYFACYYQTLAISEPLGTWLKSAFGGHLIFEHFTWLTVLLLLGLLIAAVIRFSVNRLDRVPAAPTVLITIAASLGVLLQYSAQQMAIDSLYRLIVGASFYALQIFTYYLFYAITRETRRSLDLTALAHKEQLDREMLTALQENMENIHILRHELKNHLAYIRALVASSEFDRLFSYCNQVLGENEAAISQTMTGNSVVDAVLGHTLRKAKEKHIQVKDQIVIPPELPFEETDFCSIISNLFNNALEAAEASGQESPCITVSIMPRQDYLFIRMTNPVSSSLSQSRILSLKTTKVDAAVHGYGVRVIRSLVDKYHGSCRFSLKDGRFIADIMLELSTEYTPLSNQSLEEEHEKDAPGNL